MKEILKYKNIKMKDIIKRKNSQKTTNKEN
jgi:hypothetical protein